MADIPNKKPTSYDVAKLAGVHRSAVSRAFSDGKSISDETRRKVVEAAQSIGYRVNYLARGLHAQNSGLVGIVASRLETSHRARQVKLISGELVKSGFTPILLTADGVEDLRGHMSGLLNFNVSGMIITSDTPPPDIIEECSHLSVPVVLINRAPSVAGADRVQLDIKAAGRMAFQMLHEAGATRFGVLEPKAQTYSVVGRAREFAQNCKSEGFDVTIIKTQEQSYKDGLAASDDIQSALDSFDGIFCTTDLMAFGVLDGLRIRHDVSVPEQVRILGFDDADQAEWSGYNLSTISQNIEDSGKVAVELMMKRLADPSRILETRTIALTSVHRGTTHQRPKS